MKLNKNQLKEAVRLVVRKYLLEQVQYDEHMGISEKIEKHMETWVRNNLSLIQDELESSAAHDSNTPPLASDFRDLFVDKIIGDAKELDVVKALSQEQDQVNSIIDRVLSKVISKEWETAIEVAQELSNDYMEDMYGDETMDPYLRRGLSRDDF